MSLQDRIDQYVPLNAMESALKYLFLNNIPLDQVDYKSRAFLRSFRAEKGMSHEETLRKFRRFFTAAASGSYLSTEIYIPKGRSMYIRKFPRYLIDNSHLHKDALEINMVLQGEFLQVVGKQALRLKAGDVCFMAPNTVHATRVVDDNAVVLNFLIYQHLIKDLLNRLKSRESRLQTFFTKILVGQEYHPYLICETGFDKDLAGIIINLEENQDEQGPFTDLYMEAGLELFILRILMQHRDKIILGEDIQKKENDIRTFLDYIEANYATITLRSLAETYHYSESHLSGLIKATCGKSFHEIITELKMEKAVELLLETDYSMAMIAETAGYTDKSYFLRRFKQMYGMTPTAYKKQMYGMTPTA